MEIEIYEVVPGDTGCREGRMKGSESLTLGWY